MPNNTKYQHFRTRFREWRGNEAAREEPLFAKAILISNYVEETALETIANDLRPGSNIYASFGNSYESTYSAFLYAKLAVEDYHLQREAARNLTDGERACLDSILTNLKNLYENPRENLSQRFDALITAANHWLDNYIEPNPDPALVKATCKSLYTVLKFFDVKFTTLAPSERFFLRTLSFDRQRTLTDIQALREKTATKMAALQRSNAPGAPQPNLAIQTYFEEQCLAIINQEDARILADKMVDVGTYLATVNAHITSLLAVKTEEDILQTQIEHAQKVLAAIDSNEKRIIGKQYALALIEENIASVTDLINSSSEIEKLEWVERLQELRNPGIYRAALGTAQYGLSWATSISTIAYRALAPAMIKSVVDSFAPTTFDSECKTRLRALAVARISALHGSLNNVIERKAQAVTRIVRENGAAKEWLLSATRTQIEEIHTSNQSIHQIVTNYNDLSGRITSSQEKLQAIENLKNSIEHFITQHHGFFVMLSFILSRISPLFKTDTAKKIEEIQELKNRVRDFQREYEQSLNDGVRVITDNPALSSRLKATFMGTLTPREEEDAPAQVPSVPADKFAAYSLVKTMFSQIEPRRPAVIAETATTAPPGPPAA